MQEGKREREGRWVAKKRSKKEMRGERVRCPWGWGHWSRQSLERVMRAHWGRGGYWRS